MRLFHVSDLHFGGPAVVAQIDAIEAHIRAAAYDVVAISGDVSQRARAGEFQRAAAFIRDARLVSRVLCVPGNHDVAWWRSPLHVRGAETIYEPYRQHLDRELEPVLRVPGATIVGLNTAHGVSLRTLTWNMRDLSIIGDLRPAQLAHAKSEFSRSATGDVRVIVMHHNPVKGDLSGRHGLKHTKRILGSFAAMGVDLVLCGHDHQEAIHYVEHTKRGTVISTAGTVSNRSRGGRPSSVNVITVTGDEIRIVTNIWSREDSDFMPGPSKCFARSSHD
ncbi:MAG: metallophosphoesterase [Gemmatimonadaceae bacterium]